MRRCDIYIINELLCQSEILDSCKVENTTNVLQNLIQRFIFIVISTISLYRTLDQSRACSIPSSTEFGTSGLGQHAPSDLSPSWLGFVANEAFIIPAQIAHPGAIWRAQSKETPPAAASLAHDWRVSLLLEYYRFHAKEFIMIL